MRLTSDGASRLTLACQVLTLLGLAWIGLAIDRQATSTERLALNMEAQLSVMRDILRKPEGPPVCSTEVWWYVGPGGVCMQHTCSDCQGPSQSPESFFAQHRAHIAQDVIDYPPSACNR